MKFARLRNKVSGTRMKPGQVGYFHENDGGKWQSRVYYLVKHGNLPEVLASAIIAHKELEFISEDEYKTQLLLDS